MILSACIKCWRVFASQAVCYYIHVTKFGTAGLLGKMEQEKQEKKAKWSKKSKKKQHASSALDSQLDNYFTSAAHKMQVRKRVRGKK